jgi:hypothetical protein
LTSRKTERSPAADDLSFADGDLDAARRAMACHRTQYSEEVVAREFALGIEGLERFVQREAVK